MGIVKLAARGKNGTSLLSLILACETLPLWITLRGALYGQSTVEIAMKISLHPARKRVINLSLIELTAHQRHLCWANLKQLIRSWTIFLNKWFFVSLNSWTLYASMRHSTCFSERKLIEAFGKSLLGHHHRHDGRWARALCEVSGLFVGTKCGGLCAVCFKPLSEREMKLWLNVTSAALNFTRHLLFRVQLLYSLSHDGLSQITEQRRFSLVHTQPNAVCNRTLCFFFSTNDLLLSLSRIRGLL